MLEIATTYTLQGLYIFTCLYSRIVKLMDMDHEVRLLAEIELHAGHLNKLFCNNVMTTNFM